MNDPRPEPRRLGAPEVRPARVDDGRHVARILAELGRFGPEGPLLARAITLIPDADDLTRSMLVVELTGEVVGFVHLTWHYPVFLDGPEAYVTELFVREDARGRGAGTALLEAVHRQARELGAHRVRLLVDRDGEAYRRGFYLRHGHAEQDRLAVFEHAVAPRPDPASGSAS